VSFLFVSSLFSLIIEDRLCRQARLYGLEASPSYADGFRRKLCGRTCVSGLHAVQSGLRAAKFVHQAEMCCRADHKRCLRF